MAESEILVRFVFSPIHVRKNGELKPAAFSHIYTKGCSVQRDAVATDEEIVTFVKSFLSKRDDFSWIGVLYGQCQNVRDVRVGESGERAICVFDTAEPGNPAHGEMCQTQHVIDEADKLELNRKLLAAFGDGVIVKPTLYRNGVALGSATPSGSS